MFFTTHILLISSLFYIVMGRHVDFRERFLERKRLRSLQDETIKTLNKHELNNKEVLDDIAHYMKIKGRSSPAWKKIRAIEKDFRRLLAMDGMKYNYKRDLFWRTWRSIPPVNGDAKQIVSYKCNNPIHGNAKECQSCGMWTIEDRTPPCPFEFFSVLSDEKLCGANYTQYKDVNNICPSVIKFSDLTATCDNPIETHWRFTKKYGVTEKYNEVICKGQDFCEIFTTYEITPEHVIFRIINSTNDVIYSRIMKAKNRNYICVEDCGRLNPNTRKVAKFDKPLKLDLLTVRKAKRENVSIMKRHALNEMNNENLLKKLPKKDVLNEMNGNVPKRAHFSNEMKDKVPKREHFSKGMNDNVPKREHFSKGMNDKVPKREHFSKGMNDNVPKREHFSKGMNDNVPKRVHFSNEITEGLHLQTELTKEEDVLNETNDSNPKRENILNVMNEDLHLTADVTKTEEDFNDVLPSVEENMSQSSFDGDGFVLVSIEQTRPLLNLDKAKKKMSIQEKSLRKIKSRGMKERQENDMYFVEERFLLKPTFGPSPKLKKEADRTSYEDANLEMEKFY